MGDGSDANWTLLDEYTAIVRQVCLDQDFELLERGPLYDYENPKTTRHFKATARTQPVVVVERTRPWGQTYRTNVSLPKPVVHFSIKTDYPDIPLHFQLSMRLRSGEYSDEEIAEHARWQDRFVVALRNAVDQKRKELAQEQIQIQGSQPAQAEIRAKPILGIEESKQKRKLGRITLSFALALVSAFLGLIGNVAANQLPGWLQSYLPFSLPVFFVLALLFVAFSVFQVYAE